MVVGRLGLLVLIVSWFGFVRLCDLVCLAGLLCFIVY